MSPAFYLDKYGTCISFLKELVGSLYTLVSLATGPCMGCDYLNLKYIHCSIWSIFKIHDLIVLVMCGKGIDTMFLQLAIYLSSKNNMWTVAVSKYQSILVRTWSRCYLGTALTAWFVLNVCDKLNYSFGGVIFAVNWYCRYFYGTNCTYYQTWLYFWV